MPEVTTYTVQAGDSLWEIATRFCTVWPEIYDLNREALGGNPNVILVGTILQVVDRCADLESAAVFGFIHIFNPGATAVTAFGNALGGIIYAIAFLGAKNIWFPIALHFSWNLSQALLGLPVSGQEFGGILVQNHLGPEVLTGGAYGPEGGLVGMAFRFVIMAMVLFYLERMSHGGQGNVRNLDYEIGPEPNAASA